MDVEKIERVEDMPVYQLFYKLALQVEEETRNCIPEFRWHRIQLLKSSESVCANMTEGFYSQYSTEYLQCLYRSRREARETMMHVNYGVDVRVLRAEARNLLTAGYENALRQLGNLIASIERKIQSRGKVKPAMEGVKEDSESFEPSTIDHQPLTMF